MNHKDAKDAKGRRRSQRWSEEGDRKFDAGDFAGALTSYDKAVAIKPDNHEAWYYRGIALYELGRYEEAIASCDKAIEIKPDDNYTWNFKGAVLCDCLGKYEEAIISFDKAIEIKPDYHEAWHNRGIALGNSGRYEEVIASYDRAIEIKPDEHEAWSHRGFALGNLGRYEDAIVSFDKVVAIKPDNHEAWYYRGFALGNLGRYEDAIVSFDKVVAIKPDDHEAWYYRGVALGNLGRDEDAIVSFDKVVAIKPDNHEAWYARGLALGNLERYEEAITSFDKVVEFKPDYHEAWYNRGIALRDLGRNEEVIASFDKAIEIKPDEHKAWHIRGVVLCDHLQKYEEALTFFDKAIEIKPDDDQYWYNRGIALSNLERNEEAITSFDKAIAIKPDFHLTWLNRGIAAGESITCNRFLSLMSNIARQNPHLNQRGYEGKLASYEEGLKHCPQDTHPEGWGELHHAIGDAHYSRGLSASHPRSYRNKAANSYNQALITLTATDFPEQHLEVLQDLIHVRLDLGDTAKAEELRRRGTDVLRRLLDECKSPGKKRQLGLKFASFQQLTVDIAVQSGNWCAALELAEKGKNTCLSWLLENYPTPSPLLDKERGGFSRGEVKEIQQLLNPATAIVYWHLSPAALHTFILKHNSPSPIMLGKTLQVAIRHHTSSPIVWEATKFVNPAQRLHKFENWVKKWNEQYANYRQSKDKTVEGNNNWRNNLPKLLEELTNLLDIPTILKSIQTSTSSVTKTSASSVTNPIPIQNLILVPHRDLHRLPLHALFPDNFTITYLPSLQIGLSLAELSPRQQHTNSPSKLLSIENPNSTASEDKPFPPLLDTEIESAAITRIFPNPQRLADNHVTQENLISALQSGHDIFHFTGHGTYNFPNPQTSALALSGEHRLTLTDILQLSLSNYRLVSLSACETAVTGNQTITTEYVGLVSGFLFQGVSNVVSTLWTVPDSSSSLLMIYFYWQLSKGKSPQIALTKATKWLRNLTYKKQERIYRLIFDRLPTDDKPIRPFLRKNLYQIRKMDEEQKKIKPFAHPYYWAAFIITG
ncbi:MAG: tetratricopeptide repeat protein [Calothrix sp. MO_167.B42]|nr:tetratricopeptide repeat protein [Calothrix sp. MO_167.B42]